MTNPIHKGIDRGLETHNRRHQRTDCKMYYCPQIILKYFISGFLWSAAFVEWIVNVTNFTVNPSLWTDCKLQYFLVVFPRALLFRNTHHHVY